MSTTDFECLKNPIGRQSVGRGTRVYTSIGEKGRKCSGERCRRRSGFFFNFFFFYRTTIVARYFPGNFHRVSTRRLAGRLCAWHYLAYHFYTAFGLASRPSHVTSTAAVTTVAIRRYVRPRRSGRVWKSVFLAAKGEGRVGVVSKVSILECFVFSIGCSLIEYIDNVLNFD